MSTPTLNLYPSGQIEKDDLQQRLEQKVNDVNSFNISIFNIKK